MPGKLVKVVNMVALLMTANVQVFVPLVSQTLALMLTFRKRKVVMLGVLLIQAQQAVALRYVLNVSVKTAKLFGKIL